MLRALLAADGGAFGWRFAVKLLAALPASEAAALQRLGAGGLLTEHAEWRQRRAPPQPPPPEAGERKRKRGRDADADAGARAEKLVRRLYAPDAMDMGAERAAALAAA